ELERAEPGAGHDLDRIVGEPAAELAPERDPPGDVLALRRAAAAEQPRDLAPGLRGPLAILPIVATALEVLAGRARLAQRHPVDVEARPLAALERPGTDAEAGDPARLGGPGSHRDSRRPLGGGGVAA